MNFAARFIGDNEVGCGPTHCECEYLLNAPGIAVLFRPYRHESFVRPVEHVDPVLAITSHNVFDSRDAADVFTGVRGAGIASHVPRIAPPIDPVELSSHDWTGWRWRRRVPSQDHPWIGLKRSRAQFGTGCSHETSPQLPRVGLRLGIRARRRSVTAGRPKRRGLSSPPRTLRDHSSRPYCFSGAGGASLL